MRINKWKQYILLKKNSDLKKHLPITKKLNKKSFWEMIGEHKIVIIKPIQGSLGRSIYQVSIIDETKNFYEIHHEGIIKKIKGKHETYSYIKSRINPRRFLVQQKIRLVSIDKRPVDFRVMVQRRRVTSKWRITGKFAKVAKRGYIITNVAKEVIYFKEALQQTSLNKKEMQEIIRVIDWAALTATLCFASVRPNCRIIGFDFGVDEQGQVWIIEANFKPMIFPFKMLENQSMYQTILKYKFGGNGKKRKKASSKKRN